VTGECLLMQLGLDWIVCCVVLWEASLLVSKKSV
jgi:hypothetical protein